ncbi:MAG TPA: hypothetical protein VM619_04205 [Luteimonas sp.]|nr:hypothetical protein [Luteimonas sp.]
MRGRDFGLSNAYLKAGLVLVVASLAVIAWMSFFAAAAARQGVAGAVCGVALLAGVVVHAIGRVVRARGAGGAAP